MLALTASPSTFDFGTNVTGDIYFVSDWGSFPEASWNDFPVIVINWWLEGLARLDDATSSSELLSFMDGPYSIRADLRSDYEVDLTYLHRDRVVGRAASIPLQTLIDLVRAAGLSAVVACDKAGWSSQDLMSLRRRLLPRQDADLST